MGAGRTTFPRGRIVLAAAALAMAWAPPLAGAAPTPRAGPHRLLVACAASAVDAVGDLARGFERETGIRVELTPGSSGKFFNQLSQGAPFDLFFSADAVYPAGLEARGLTSDRRRYARGGIVLWARRASPVDVRRGLGVLADPGVTKVAIANPRVAPYGRAAIEALQAAGVYGQVRRKLVIGENMAQASQFVESGAAGAGILSLSLAVSPRLAARGKYWLVPARSHGPIDADAVVLARSPRQEAARRFLAFATDPAAAPVWRRHGFHAPPQAAAR